MIAPQFADVSFDRLVRTAEADLQLQILVNALGGKSGFDLLQNQWRMIFAQAFSPVFPGGRKWVNLKPFISTLGGSF
jgi:hypothetical protein